MDAGNQLLIPLLVMLAYCLIKKKKNVIQGAHYSMKESVGVKSLTDTGF